LERVGRSPEQREESRAGGLSVRVCERTSVDQEEGFWCEVMLPAWSRRSFATRLNSPAERMELDVFGGSISTGGLDCSNGAPPTLDPTT